MDSSTAATAVGANASLLYSSKSPTKASPHSSCFIPNPYFCNTLTNNNINSTLGVGGATTTTTTTTANVNNNANNMSCLSAVNPTAVAARNSLEQHEDISMLTLATEIDAHMSGMRSSVLTAVAAIRARILNSCAEQLTAQRVQFESQVDALVMHVNGIEGALEASEKARQAANEKIDRLVTHVCVTKQRAQKGASIKAMFDRWRANAAKKAMLKAKSDSLAETSAKAHLRNAFARWRINSLQHAITTTQQRAALHVQKEVSRVTGDKEMKEAQWAMERLQLCERLRVEEERRGLLEQQLKAAFMRGVCALNMEAMSVLRGTANISDAVMSMSTMGPTTPITESTTAACGGGGVSAPAPSSSVTAAAEMEQNFKQMLEGLSGIPTMTTTATTATVGNNTNAAISSSPQYSDPYVAQCLLEKQMSLLAHQQRVSPPHPWQQEQRQIEVRAEEEQEQQAENAMAAKFNRPQSASAPHHQNKSNGSSFAPRVAFGSTTAAHQSASSVTVNLTAKKDTPAAPLSSSRTANTVNKVSSSIAVSSARRSPSSQNQQQRGATTSIPTSVSRSNTVNNNNADTNNDVTTVQRHTGVEVRVTRNPAYGKQ